MRRYKRLSTFAPLALWLLLVPAPVEPVAAEEKLLVFGRVYHDPVRTIRDRQEFVDYIARKLAPVGITGGRIVVVDKMHLLARAVTEDKVDYFHDSVVPTIVLSKWSGSVPILRQWKYGEAEYYGVILVKKDSGIDTLSGLRGKVIAFDEPHSTSAHILPRMLLAENKIKLVQMTSSAAAQPDKVGYLYGSDGSSPNLLITGRVDAAATSYREFEELRPQVRETLKVIGRTKSVARQIISVRKNLNSKIAKALRQVLLNMHKDPEGREALKKQQRTTKIDEISPKSLEELKSMQSFVFSTLGKEVDSW
ncbi:MAG: phosphate/phosphite/phosphonate ABC transporter substrate-binding protein [Deltaproteobacteria bacterium]|nr:phosphate/phosphite/phosphonate ABC transporter substrate-binding protein [Deltaproteobacteria bacterium]MBI2347087.1 phosphate/phosphite/phosphonate ABC transporter substrate-binding protein [Deltaproteobacteria bacterium]